MQVDLEKLLGDVMEISAQLVKPDVHLEMRFHPATPAITADKKRLTQIFYNLLGNSLKFTNKGSVHLEVKPVQHGSQVGAV